MMNSTEIIKTQEQKIEELHERTLIMDKNYDRVKKLHLSEEIQIKDLQAIRRTLEEGNQKFLNDKNTLLSEIKKLEADKSGLKIDIDSSTKNFVSINSQILEAEKSLAERKDEVSKKEAVVLSRHNSVSERELSVSKREDEANQKHAKIKELANSLN